MGLWDKIHDTVEDGLGGAGRAYGAYRKAANKAGKGVARAGLTELGRYETLIPTPQWKQLPRWMKDDFVQIDPKTLKFKWGWHSDPNDVARFKEEWRKHPVSSGVTVAGLALPFAKPLIAANRAARIERGIKAGDRAGLAYQSYGAWRPPVAVAARRRKPERPH